MTNKHFKDWTPEDEVILCKQEIARLEKEFRGANTPQRHDIQKELLRMNEELTEWKSKCKSK